VALLPFLIDTLKQRVSTWNIATAKSSINQELPTYQALLETKSSRGADAKVPWRAISAYSSFIYNNPFNLCIV